MNVKKIFQNYYGKIVRQAWIQALVRGLSFGLFSCSAVAVAGYFFFYRWWWIAFAVGAAVAVIATVILYFAHFRPAAFDVARRLDGTGQQERMVTMLEYRDDESFMAQIQRKDAKDRLAALDRKKLKLHISRAAIVTAAVAVVWSIGAVGINLLAEKGVIRSGEAMLNPPVQLEVVYEADGGGEIMGDIVQLVYKGDSADPVFAVAEEGWMFYCWSDGSEDPDRRDINIEKDITLTAIFVPLDEDGADEGDVPGDEPGNVPKKPGEGTGDNKPGEGPGAGGKYEGYNFIDNGETYYRDVYEQNYYSSGIDEATGNSNYSDGQRDATAGYLEAIK